MYLYASILLPLAQPLYTFSTANFENIEVGSAVTVQFGKRSVYTGIVWSLHNNPPQKGSAKPILSIVYNKPLLSAIQMKFWEWIASYYICSLGEVMRIALPSLIKPHSIDEQSLSSFDLPTATYITLCNIAPEVEEQIKRRSPKRYSIIEQLRLGSGKLLRTELNADSTTLNALLDRGVIKIDQEEVKHTFVATTFDLPKLTQEQNIALSDIYKGFENHLVTLLYGVTSSGKTEVYTHLIAQKLNQGKDVLYLVPEISLTPQIVARLQNIFGSSVIAYHSRLTPTKRAKIFMNLLNSDGGNLIIGARSALFLPLNNLGLVIVDDEHDTSYKQTEPNPRYHGRDTAILLASLYGAKVVLGSATPSLESFASTMNDKYALAQLPTRYGGATMPKIIISNTLEAVKRGERKNHLNLILRNKIEERLSLGEQVILFQNRRGYSPYIECEDCGYIPKCPRCNVSLSLHKGSGKLRCHYCEYSMPIPTTCPKCGSTKIAPMGFGTEKMEEAIKQLFPNAVVDRLDRDTATSESAYNRIISSFAEHKTDILIGTQIVTKGLDFGGVTLIGILNADNLLNSPDFRANERAWQTIEQVAGRCGRRDRQGEVILQTAEPDHPLFALLNEQNYRAMAHTLLKERRLFSYPPYSRLIRFRVRGAEYDFALNVANSLAAQLSARFGKRLYGPVTPLTDFIRGEHIFELTLKIEVEASFNRARDIVREILTPVWSDYQLCRKVSIICDVDFV